MIGRRCKAGDSLSRAALIARALTRRIPAGAAACAWRVQLKKVDQDIRSGELAVRPPGHAETPTAWEARNRLKTSAAHRSAAMAGGARPDPFRTRKLSRRAPMVLRGQPVGEQGAADRWTALDPHPAGSGAGAPRGMPAAPPSFSHMRSQGPPGPFFHGRRGPGPRAAPPPGCLFAGWMDRTYRNQGPGGPFFMARSPSLKVFLAGRHLLCRALRARIHGSGRLGPHAAPGDPPVCGSGAPGSAPSRGRSARRWRSRCREPGRLPASLSYLKEEIAGLSLGHPPLFGE